ncbi:MAG TPA: hypothetical protein VFJ97_01355 [Dermatophilaceae bacterium]|nr:hypothetical protein [Dermatophilaceae bacterium]
MSASKQVFELASHASAELAGVEIVVGCHLGDGTAAKGGRDGDVVVCGVPMATAIWSQSICRATAKEHLVDHVRPRRLGGHGDH